MNWTEEDIDQLFRDSANQLNVPFQESYWTEMEALLPQTKKKKGLGWIFGGTIVCLALISTFFFPENSQNTQQTTAEIVKEHSKTISPVNSDFSPQKFQENPMETLADNTIQNKNQIKSAKSQRLPNKAKSNYSLISVNQGENYIQGTESQMQSPLQVEETIPYSIEKLKWLDLPNKDISLATSTFKNATLTRKSNSLYVQIGGGLSESYMQTNSNNWMPTMNIGVGYQYSPQGFGFSAGLNLNTAFSDNLEINRKSKVYNFGSTNYEQNFRYKQIYTLELPVSIDFRKNKQTFSVGIAPTYIASSLMRFSQLENGNLSQDEIYIGQKVGLNHFGLKPSIGYQLELAKGWNVGMQLSTQLIQQVDDSQFIGTSRNNPLSGQISIRKTITKF